ncbi:MAG: PKD domain-containing protein [Acidobacteriota bacterium]
MSRPAAGLLLLLSTLGLTACDKVPLLAPTQSTLTLSVNTTTLPINGTAEVTATLVEQGGTAVHNGTTVTFTASVGVVEPRDARTENGIARVTFRAGVQSGTAKIGAFSGSARATEVEILVGGAAAQTVSVRLEPSSVPQTGGTVQVIAIVVDAAGNRLPGAPVIFSTDNGTLGSNSGTTDDRGEARTTLTTNRQSIVRASVAGKEGQATLTVVTLPTASITVSPAAPLVGLPVTFTVTPGNAAGGNPIQNVTLDFGDGGPPANLGAITSATAVSHVYERADTYTATVTVTDTAGQRASNSTLVTVLRPVISVSLTAPSTSLVGAPLSVTVSVSNPSNVPIQSVILTYGDGTAASLSPSGGTAAKTYITSGTFTITATATDQTGSQYRATAQIVVAPATALNVTLDAQSGDPAVSFNCTAGTTYPKTCTANFVGIGVRAILTAGCNAGFGAGACANATAYQWSYGDGTSETTTSSSVDHVYRTRGEFIITVTVITNTGTSGSQRLTLITQ